MKPSKAEIGVIIGRFQIHQLHEAHKELISNVISNHRRVIVFLGVTPVLMTKKNPLDFPTRKAMIEEEFGNSLTVAAIPDFSDDDKWSKALDSRIREIHQIGDVLLYGGRDSFLGHYSGQFPTKELEQDTFVSGTEVRKNISKDILRSPDFRAGVIYATYNRYPIVYSTIDAAIFNDEYTELLLAKKPNETLYRFVGGFVDPTDSNDGIAVKRECMEETGLEVGDMKYLESFKVDDWRYRNSGDCIMTRLFTCKRLFGRVTPSDDISECKWFNVPELSLDVVVDEHKPLMNYLIEYLKTKS